MRYFDTITTIRKYEFPENVYRELGTDEEYDKETLIGYLDSLPNRCKRVIEMRYKDQMTFSAIGKVFGVQHERARQILAKTLRVLRGKYTGR